MNAMNGPSKTDDRCSSPAAVLVAVAVMLLPMVYVLSLGPAILLHNLGYLPDAVGVIYEPLEFVHEHCNPIGDTLDWYIELWQ